MARQRMLAAGPRRPTSSSRTRRTSPSRCGTTASVAAPRSSRRAPTCSPPRSARSPREHDVPIVENPPLARALYAQVEVGDEIPPRFFAAVAEVLAYVYRTVARRKLSLASDPDAATVADGRTRRIDRERLPPRRSRSPEPRHADLGVAVAVVARRRDDGRCRCRRSCSTSCITVNIALALGDPADDDLREATRSTSASSRRCCWSTTLLPARAQRRVDAADPARTASAGQRHPAFGAVRRRRQLRRRHRRLPDPRRRSSSSSSRRAPGASPKSRRASPSTPCPASRWRSTPT